MLNLKDYLNKEKWGDTFLYHESWTFRLEDPDSAESRQSSSALEPTILKTRTLPSPCSWCVLLYFKYLGITKSATVPQIWLKQLFEQPCCFTLRVLLNIGGKYWITVCRLLKQYTASSHLSSLSQYCISSHVDKQTQKKPHLLCERSLSWDLNWIVPLPPPPDEFIILIESLTVSFVYMNLIMKIAVTVII